MRCTIFRGLVKGVDKVGDILDEDIDIMITTNVVGLINVRTFLFRPWLCADSARYS
jgi:NADP-dependent 3-hydroxy acid dehydrogenase YdfG